MQPVIENVEAGNRKSVATGTRHGVTMSFKFLGNFSSEIVIARSMTSYQLWWCRLEKKLFNLTKFQSL